MSGIPDKICYECEYFSMTTGSPDYSSLTPGWSWDMECHKRMWEFDTFEDNREKFKACLETALTCPHFELRPR